MRSPGVSSCERSRYSRYAYALWVTIRTGVIIAGVCWLILNAAVFSGYLRSADPVTLFSFEPRSGSSSSSRWHSGGESSGSVAISDNNCRHAGAALPCSSSSRAELQKIQQDLVTLSAEAELTGAEPTQTPTEHRLEYVAVGKITPSENGEYAGAGPDRMHGNLGLYHDGTSAYVTAPPPLGIPVQELLSRGGGLNVLLSDHLPLDRAAVDSRISSCKRQQYDISNLPKASVVIIFYNEPFSTLLRSVHSVLNLTPPPLLEEIILVDDGSDLDYITGSRRFTTAAAAAGPGGIVEGLRQFAAVKFSDGEAEVIKYSAAEDEEEDRRRLARLRSRPQHAQQPPLPGSPNYRVTPTLKEYLELLPEKVKLLRNKERKGIVGARMRGIRAAKAPVFIILDSHIEVQPQWMEPLLVRIAADRRRIVMPQIDGIEADTFEYAAGGIGCKLGFLWKLMEHSYESHQLARFAASSVKTLRSRAPPAVVATGMEGAKEGGGATRDAIRGKILTPVGSAETSPVMAGGLFAADKKFFFEIGAYDEAFQYWGTENLELSFRLWQCGGLLECAPCSRVYHIFRKGGAGYSVPPHAVTVNKMRTMLWMDQYADLAWRVLGKPRVDFGWESLQQRKKWREEKKCKNFEWFLHNVFPEGDVVDLRDVPYLGPLKNKGAHACLSVDGVASPGRHVSLQPCHGLENQDFMYFRTVGHVMPVRDDEACLEITGHLDWCKAHPKHEWKLTAAGLLFHAQTQRCLSGYKVSLRAVVCDDTDYFQVWSWTPYNPPKTFEFPGTAILRGS